MLLNPNDGKRGQLGRPPAAAGQAFRFLPREVAEMEKTLEDTKGATPSRELVQALADRFSAFPERAGKVLIQSKQVWNWFQNRRHAVKKGAKISEKQSVPTNPADASAAKRTSNTSAAVSSGVKGADPLKMEFEAKSCRDGAWYDVHSFLAYRMLDSGDPEVRVRFAGFGPEEDEWVNVRSSVRQRSLPCEATECIAVLPGDLVLCFQEGSDQALYYDAYIKDVERRRHDVRGCRCRFLVQYEHDKSAEIVPLRKICRRPETDNRLHPSNLQLAGDPSALSAKDLIPFEPKGNLQSTDGNQSGDSNSFRVELGHQLENHPLLAADSNLNSSMGFVGYKDDQIQGIPFELQAPRLG